MNKSKLNFNIFSLIPTKFYTYFLVIPILFSSCQSEKVQGDTISLAGEWMVKLDSAGNGEQYGWANGFNKDARNIRLPGTLDDANIGKKSTLEPELNNYVLSSLNRKHEYYGKAYYQKNIKIPENWKNKDIFLNLERVLWESKVFVDGKAIGSQESLIGNHRYDLSGHLTPGSHLLTIRIDNSDKYPNINVKGDRYPDEVDKEMAHAYTNHTQIKWNGILGEISLKASEKNSPKNLRVYPNFSENILNFRFNQLDSISKELQLEVLAEDGTKIIDQTITNTIKNDSTISFSVSKPEGMETWDEFSPNLYNAKITSQTGSTSVTFGLRKVRSRDGVLELNDHRIFLRGNLECVIFPLTGHPPMKKQEWSNLIIQAKKYGLNHLRFHSWCPPSEAFEAADEAGFYFQVELPHWSLKVGEDKNTTEFLIAEAKKIIRDYGNHPSFLMMSMGNELEGDMNLLNEMTEMLKKIDNRHLYATTSFSFQKPSGTRPEPADEFFIAQWTDKGWIRGQGIFNSNSPSFDEDYSENMNQIEIPVISHEIGQYSVYPDLTEIDKYTGVLEPLNFIAIKNDLKTKGLLKYADQFTNASGELAAILYKEEIERALKTEEFDGFQLLQLQDFPGQGTALVGLLNAFWESKGIISGEEFREFNSEVVPLIRFEKAVYKAGETFKAKLEVANFYREFADQEISWSILNAKGIKLKNGSFSTNLLIGNNKDLTTIEFPLQIEHAQKLKIEVKIEGTKYQNSWPIWVYPDVNLENDDDVLITASYEKAKEALRVGKSVLLNPEIENIKGINGRFVPVFWSPVHFPDQPGTMGLLIKKKHPALKDFPSSNHTEWNWWDLCIQSKSIILDKTEIDPIVRVIDNFVTNHSLGNLFEAKVGNGRLLFTSMDIQSNLESRPVAKQMKYSLLNYMKSKEFQPEVEVDEFFIDSLKPD